VLARRFYSQPVSGLTAEKIAKVSDTS